MNKILVLLVYISFSSNLFAQINDAQLKRELNNLRNGPIIASVPTERVGNGAIFWVVNANSDYIYANKIFASCDGRLLSHSFDGVIAFDDDLSKRLMEIYLKINSMDSSVRTDSVNFLSYEDIDVMYKEFVRRNIKDICIKARAERRGEQIPISDSVWLNDNTKTITSFLPGTFKRNGNIVDGWFRSYEVLRKKSDNSVFKDANGNPFYFNNLKDKSYSMIKWSFDCKAKKSSISQMINYDKSGDTTNSKSFPIDFTDVVPNSVAERILDSICKIY